MHPKSAFFVKLLSNKFQKEPLQNLVASLPEVEGKEVLGCLTALNDPALVLKPPVEQLLSVHYSWLAKDLEKWPESLWPYIVASFPSPVKEKLCKYAKVENIKEEVNPVFKAFFLKKLADQFWSTDILPKAFFSQGSLSFLMYLDKEALVELIDFLGLYDLAEEVRHLVDKRLLKEIYSQLTFKKVQFLRALLPQKERLTVPKLHLEKWDRSKKAFVSLLHKRGISRLAKALSGQASGLVWYLVHTLDIGRGKLLEAQVGKEELLGISSILLQQMIYTFNFLNQKAVS